MKFSACVFDLDGTLLDSDAALRAPFLRLGVAEADVTYGHVLAEECRRLGLAVEDYLAAYDRTAAQPFPGVEDLVARLDHWAVCSNKHGDTGRAELARLGWRPAVALFADAFGGGAKVLGPVVKSLGVDPATVLFVGDTDHDRACAAAAGAGFALAGWNPRAQPQPGDLVLRAPAEVLELLRD